MKRLFGLVLLALSSFAAAQDALEVIPLRHRTAEQVIPVRRPLLAPGGALTGRHNQLIVRTTPSNLAQLRGVLEAIDRPARRLAISVRFDGADSAARSGAQGSVRIAPGGSSAGLRVEAARVDRGLLSAGERATSAARAVWVKVEERR